jgi:hypothetical protein
MRRRWFFRRFAGEGIALLEELSGQPHLPTNGLWQLPTDMLLAVKPAYRPGVTVFADAGRMLGRCPGSEPVDLYGLDDAGTFVLSRFDGWSPLGDIAAELVSARDWGAPEAQALAREVFLKLVGLGLCAPANPMDDAVSLAVRNGTGIGGGDYE